MDTGKNMNIKNRIKAITTNPKFVNNKKGDVYLHLKKR